MYYSPTCPICKVPYLESGIFLTLIAYKAMMPLMADLSVASDALKDEVDSSREFKVGIVDCQKSKVMPHSKSCSPLLHAIQI